MTKKEFKTRWESDEDGGGITFDDIAKCAVEWGISPRPKIRPLDLIMYQVLSEAKVNDAEEYKTE